MNAHTTIIVDIIDTMLQTPPSATPLSAREGGWMLTKAGGS